MRLIKKMFGHILFLLLINATSKTLIDTTSKTTTTYELSEVQTEESPVTPIIACYKEQSVENYTIKWQKSLEENNSLYFGEPHCINQTNFYELRTCTDGNLEMDDCYKVQRELNFCPYGFTTTQKGCCKLFPQTTYENSKCPQYSRFEVNVCVIDAPIWFFAERNLEYGIGEFFYTFGPFYGEVVGPRPPSRNMSKSNCVTWYQSELQAVPCNSKHYSVCSYSFLQSEHYCQKLFGPSIRSTFESNLKCLHKTDMEADCEPAELPYEYQSMALSTININTKCLINLGIVNSSLIWNSGAPVTYTHWNDDPNWLHQTEAPPYILTSKGWKSQQDNIDCKICESDFPYAFPTIHLKQNNELIQIELTNSDSLALIHRTIYLCFSDMFSSGTYRVVAHDPFIKIQSSGFYWCEGFEIKHLKKITSNKILVINENIFILYVSFYYEKDEDPTSYSGAWVSYISFIQLKVFVDSEKYVIVKWMKTLAVDEDKLIVDYLIHICTGLNKTKYSEDYDYINKTLYKNINSVTYIRSMSELISSEYCMETQTKSNGVILNWNRTPKDSYAYPKETCIQANGEIVKRYCSYDFYKGAEWNSFANCKIFKSHSNITEQLQELLSSNSTTKEILENLSSITQHSSSFEAIDVAIATNILDKINKSDCSIRNISEIISNIMEAKDNILEKSQFEFNSTDRILSNFDKFLETKKQNVKELLECTTKLITFIFDANADNYSGLALARNKTLKLKKNITHQLIEEIPGLEIATYIPDNLLEVVSLNNESQIIINIYLADSLFKTEDMQEVAAKKIGILLPAVNISYKIPIFYKSTLNDSCGFWFYGTKNEKPLKGKWILEGDNTKIKPNITLCEFSHVTHFGLLIADFAKQKESLGLEVITNIGCGLSLFGFLGIFIYAYFFRNWLYNKGNQILIHYSIISCIQITLMYLSNAISKSHQLTFCVIIGSGIHYSVLSQFCWMLVFALLQYKRYVQVIHSPNFWVLSKFYLACYIIPAIPVVIMLSTNMENYIQGPGGFCYPSKNGLIFTVLLPIGAIFIINLFVFIKIFSQLFCAGNSGDTTDNEIYLKISAVVLMFFMLGITWTFGFLAGALKSEICLYIFSITASMQGFVLFLFFIVLNGNCKKMYTYTITKQKRQNLI